MAEKNQALWNFETEVSTGSAARDGATPPRRAGAGRPGWRRFEADGGAGPDHGMAGEQPAQYDPKRTCTLRKSRPRL